MRKSVKRGVTVALLTAALGAAGFALYRYQYPYGWSHCCDSILSLTLLEYADAHRGWFPRGQATPEASLSLLYRHSPAIAPTLRGKTVPEAVVQERLEAGKLLTPQTCGWHYVAGLRIDDDNRLALFWDKAGLGHNGQRLPQGGHIVSFVGGTSEYIPGKQWDDFLADQAELRAGLKRPR